MGAQHRLKVNLENAMLSAMRGWSRGNKVYGPYVVTLLSQTSIIEWYMARLVVKNR